MLTLIIVLLLILAFRFGLKRGLLMTLLSVAGYVIVFLLAVFLAKPMGAALATMMPALWKNSIFSGIWTYYMLIMMEITNILCRQLKNTINCFSEIFR